MAGIGTLTRPHSALRSPVTGLHLAAVMALLVLLPASATAAGGGSAPAGVGDVVQFEVIPGTELKRIILSSKAAERLGIETVTIGREVIVRKQMLGGRVVHEQTIPRTQPPTARGAFGGFGDLPPGPVLQPVATGLTPTAGQEAWIQLAVSEDEWRRIARDTPARVLPLNQGGMSEFEARPSRLPPASDPKRSMLTVYYVVPTPDHGLNVNDRVRVEVALEGSGEDRRTVPYSAVYYDGEGLPWVYVQTAPLTYERKQVDIERIDGERAILNDGPPEGTAVVTAGAALLYGAEVIYKY